MQAATKQKSKKNYQFKYRLQFFEEKNHTIKAG